MHILDVNKLKIGIIKSGLNNQLPSGMVINASGGSTVLPHLCRQGFCVLLN